MILGSLVSHANNAASDDRLPGPAVAVVHRPPPLEPPPFPPAPGEHEARDLPPLQASFRPDRRAGSHAKPTMESLRAWAATEGLRTGCVAPRIGRRREARPDDLESPSVGGRARSALGHRGGSHANRACPSSHAKPQLRPNMSGSHANQPPIGSHAKRGANEPGGGSR